MAFWLEQRGAGVALIIDGDLQFDSRDERVYHEALVLPALALAEARAKAPLTALICGGGDGLVARELLKSARVAAIDLVDYDAALVRFARSDLAAYNDSSLDDPRVQVTALNALTFVERAREAGRNYDLIICDLTVPTDAESARLHSADWYESLTAILNPAGVIAANAVSPSGAPAAFAAICNSLRSAGLAAAPFRLPIPSFADRKSVV